MIRPNQAFAVIWLGWVVSWVAAAFWSGRTEKRHLGWRTWSYRAALFAGAVLFAVSARHATRWRLWDVGAAGGFALAGVTLASLIFAWWARLHIGRLWSGTITRKQGHRIVDTGPYAVVRHPIYTGLIAALGATAVAQATPAALTGAVLLAAGFCFKANAEERFLANELGADAYRAYRRRVPMLVPFWPR